ncbi:leucine-rich repeat extensin-like protein 7 [Iris pallida]|uniref:Leucine-rich repeat extensin-like protein 7 n=1 Tax=Iris pallida TaxID=29817 RepID=A0AAX6HMV8_IRIPA|nr:leucine-rich repeat extensin-like protein 7 [Iris pallida]
MITTTGATVSESVCPCPFHLTPLHIQTQFVSDTPNTNHKIINLPESPLKHPTSGSAKASPATATSGHSTTAATPHSFPFVAAATMLLFHCTPSLNLFGHSTLVITIKHHHPNNGRNRTSSPLR